MSELSELIYIKSHMTLHMKSNADWIGCLGPLTALLMVFDGSKQILNFPCFSNSHVTALSCWLILSACLSFAFHLLKLLFDFGMSCSRLPLVMD